MCAWHLGGDPTALTCTIPELEHPGRGHVFETTDGSWVPDHHDGTSGGEH